MIKSFLKFSIKSTIFLVVSLHLIFPIVIYVWPNVLTHLIFQSFVKNPFKNLSNPEDFGLEKTYHFKVEHDDVSLGVWHTLPKNSVSVSASDEFDKHIKKNTGSRADEILILYLHGNTQDRSAGHRVELYKLLQNQNYHIISMDYRAYGDSTGIPHEDDVVKDALFVYDLIHSNTKSPIYVWGHSLGTGIAAKLNRYLSTSDKAAAGVVLESPFYNVEEEIELHPLARIFTFNPLIISLIKSSLDDLKLNFKTNIHIQFIKSKILILHAEDDGIIPIDQARRLYSVAKEKSKSKSVELVTFESNLGLGHRNIWSAPNIVEIIKGFITQEK